MPRSVGFAGAVFQVFHLEVSSLLLSSGFVNTPFLCSLSSRFFFPSINTLALLVGSPLSALLSSSFWLQQACFCVFFVVFFHVADRWNRCGYFDRRGA